MQDCSDDSSTHSTVSVYSETDGNDGSPQATQTACGITSEGDDPMQLTPKACKMIVKSVCGKVLDREESLKLLKNKFGVTSRNLTSLTPSQLLEVASKKLLRFKYVDIPGGTDASGLKSTIIKVNKEIEL